MPVMLVTNVQPDLIKANGPKGVTFIRHGLEFISHVRKMYVAKI